MRLLIDTNVVLDVLQDREPFVSESLLIWKMCETERVEGVLSALSFANLVYVMRREMSPAQVQDVLSKLRLIFRFTDFSTADMNRAADMQWSDYEDAVQAATAERTQSDYIITRNVRDFLESPVAAFTPAEFLARFS